MLRIKKNRVEAFTDAVVAIIMTIMVLEFKIPEGAQWTAILNELPYLFAYVVSFLFIGVAWYNHHYMFALANRISKKIYWINNFWLFTMSLLPMATAWAGTYMNSRAPEYFYLLIFILWSFAYYILSKAIYQELKQSNSKNADKIVQMPPYRFMNSGTKCIVTNGLLIVAIYFFPPSCLIFALLELSYMAFHTTKDSDEIELTE